MIVLNDLKFNMFFLSKWQKYKAFIFAFFKYQKYNFKRITSQWEEKKDFEFKFLNFEFWIPPILVIKDMLTSTPPL